MKQVSKKPNAINWLQWQKQVIREEFLENKK